MENENTIGRCIRDAVTKEQKCVVWKKRSHHIDYRPFKSGSFALCRVFDHRWIRIHHVKVIEEVSIRHRRHIIDVLVSNKRTRCLVKRNYINFASYEQRRHFQRTEHFCILYVGILDQQMIWIYVFAFLISKMRLKEWIVSFWWYTCFGKWECLARKQREKEEIWLSLMTKAPTSTEMSSSTTSVWLVLSFKLSALFSLIKGSF